MTDACWFLDQGEKDGGKKGDGVWSSGFGASINCALSCCFCFFFNFLRHLVVKTSSGSSSFCFFNSFGELEVMPMSSLEITEALLLVLLVSLDLLISQDDSSNASDIRHVNVYACEGVKI